MTATRKPAAPWVAVAVLILLIGGDVGVYCWIVYPRDWQSMSGERVRSRTVARWRGIHPAWRTFFAPIHSVDVRLRSWLWIP